VFQKRALLVVGGLYLTKSSAMSIVKTFRLKSQDHVLHFHELRNSVPAPISIRKETATCATISKFLIGAPAPDRLLPHLLSGYPHALTRRQRRAAPRGAGQHVHEKLNPSTMESIEFPCRGGKRAAKLTSNSAQRAPQ